MSYTVTTSSEGYVEIAEQVYDNKGTVRYWYYDMSNLLKSVLGKKNEQPKQPMTLADVAWLQKHYLPKLETATCEKNLTSTTE